MGVVWAHPHWPARKAIARRKMKGERAADRLAIGLPPFEEKDFQNALVPYLASRMPSQRSWSAFL